MSEIDESKKLFVFDRVIIFWLVMFFSIRKPTLSSKNKTFRYRYQQLLYFKIFELSAN